jgi:hypothetical protein
VVGSVILDMFFVWLTAKATLLVEAIGKAIKAAVIITDTAIVVVVEIARKAVFFIDRLYP